MNKLERFWAKVDKSGECWNWTACISGGYGRVSWHGKHEQAHRVAYIITYGEIPKGEGYHGTVVRHKCDNKRCCNPDHLLIGSQSDNMKDVADRGRRKNLVIGVDNGMCKLTVEQVKLIRKDTRGKRTIAPEYNISPAQVQRIRKGLQWSHI